MVLSEFGLYLACADKNALCLSGVIEKVEDCDMQCLLSI